MSAHLVQLRFRGMDALVRAPRRHDDGAYSDAIARAVAGTHELTRLCVDTLAQTNVVAALLDDGERRVFSVDAMTAQTLAAARAAVEHEALVRFEGRIVPVLSAIEGEASADAHATLAALELEDARAAATPFSSQLRAAEAFGPFVLDAELTAVVMPRASSAAQEPRATIAFAIDPLRPAPAGTSGACPFLTWLLLQEAGHDLLAGVAEQHGAEFAVTPWLVWGGKAVFATNLRDALAFIDAVAADARERWRTSISCAVTFARDDDAGRATARTWIALAGARERAERGSLIVDDARMELASIARQRELAVGLETLARRAPGPVRELARAAASFAHGREQFDVGELARLRGAIHALAAKSGVNARNTRRGLEHDPAAAALAALVAESARGFESGEAILPLSYAVWMTSTDLTENAR